VGRRTFRLRAVPGYVNNVNVRVVKRESSSGKRVAAGRSICIALVVLAVAAALAARLFFAFDRGPLVADEVTYARCAENVLSGRGFVNPAFGLQLRLFLPPAYPVFLLPFRAAFDAGAFPPAVGVAQALLGLATAALAYLTARRLGGRIAGAAAGLAGLLHPYLAFFAGRVLTETLSLFLLAVFLWLYLERDGGPYRLAGAGAALALAALTRPVFLYVAALACVCLLFRRADERWRRRLLNVGAMAAAFVVVLAPWTARNYALSGRFIPAAYNSGRVLYQGNNSLGPEGALPPPREFMQSEEFRRRVAAGGDSPVAAELAFQDYTRENALRAISDNKKEFVTLSLGRLAHTFALFPTLGEDAGPVPGGSLAGPVVGTFFVLLYVAAAVGFFAVPGRLPKLFLPLACLVNLGIHAVTISLLRYRLPIDLILTLAAGFGIKFIWEKARRRTRGGELT